MAMQLKKLRDANCLKDNQIRSLQQQLNFPDKHLDENIETTTTSSNLERPQGFVTEAAHSHSLSNSYMDSNEFLSTLQREFKEPFRKDNKKVKYCGPQTVEEKFRSEVDDLLEESLELWLRFSTAFHQIKKFQSSVRDLQADLSKLKGKRKEGSTRDRALQSETRPIFKHLREIQHELTLWLERNSVLQDELQERSSSLSKIQGEIDRFASEETQSEEPKLSQYQVAKFQGEVTNMKQENKKILDELQAGFDRVKGIQTEVEKTLESLDTELGISASGSQSASTRSSSSRLRIPLKSFLFGIKLKRSKTKSSITFDSSPTQQESSNTVQDPEPQKTTD